METARHEPPLDPPPPYVAGVAEIEDAGRTTSEKRTFATSSARHAPLVLSPSEELWYRLNRPVRLPRVPRPPIRRIAAFAISLVPSRIKNSRGVGLVRRYPALTASVLMFAGVGATIAGLQFVEPNFRWEPERYQKWLARRGARATKATLAEIGPSVEIPTVQAQPTQEMVLGYYTFADKGITFNSNREYHEIDLLRTASHECVHGIFHQNNLGQPSSTHADYFLMVDETAAYVLGAFVAGEAWSRRGHDPSILWETLFLKYRRACDPADPESMYTEYLAPGRPGSGDFDQDEWRDVLVHFGSPLQLVDAVYEICYLHTDPTDAAREIAKRFMTTDLQGKDKAILEEFERTRRRWDEGG